MASTKKAGQMERFKICPTPRRLWRRMAANSL